MTDPGDSVREVAEGRRPAGPDRPARSARPAGPWWWERRRSFVLDVVLAVVSAVECAVQGFAFAGETGLPRVLGVLLGVAAGSTLVLRRRWPVAVVLVAVAVTPAEMGVLLGMCGLYTLAASEVPRRITAGLTGMSFLGSGIVIAVRLQQDVDRQPSWDPGLWFVPTVAVAVAVALTVPPVLLGLYVGARRRLVESLRERADGLERELSLLADRAEERAEWARREERTRIAREMHDVVAHRVSLMVVHAAALQAVAVKDPERARRNAALVGDMGRQALSELRTMLGVLREPGQPQRARAGVPSEGGVEEGPEVPGLGGLDALVAQSREAGMTVELSVEGERPQGYGARVERTAYRVVQEALTNVHKHAAGARTWVRLAYRGGEVALQVENACPAEGVVGAGLPSGGNGLVGMRERVTSLGGVFVSGPTEAGGFRVSAVIPDA